MVRKYLQGEIFRSTEKWQIILHYLAYKTTLSRRMLVCTFTKLYPHLLFSDSFLYQKAANQLSFCTHALAHVIIGCIFM